MRQMTCLRLLALLPIIVLSGVARAAEPSDPKAAAVPEVIAPPGPEYADAVRMFQGIPGIERTPSGRLWATWYGGGVTEDRHNYILLATSGDDGQTWSGVKLVVDPDRDGPVRAFDPCLWTDPQGRLWLFWAQCGDNTPQLLAMTTENPGDENPTWSKPRWICEGIMMNKPTVAADGRWLLPTAIRGRPESNRVVASADRGQRWELIGAATVPEKKDRNCDEPMIVQRGDGSLWLLVRTGYGIGQSESRDDGKTWQGGLLLDERDGVEGPDGTIYVIYDFSRINEKLILMATFTEADVAQGKAVSSKLRLRVRINQATGVGPNMPKK